VSNTKCENHVDIIEIFKIKTLQLADSSGVVDIGGEINSL
jgi:hypothetical protein